MNRWEEVHRLRDREQRSVREIARILGMGRNTVNKLLALEQPPPDGHLISRSLLDPYKGTILALLEREPRMPATAMHRLLAERGYAGGITILRDYLAIVRPRFVNTLAWKALTPMGARVVDESASLDVDGGEINLTGLVPPRDSEAAMMLISSDFEIVAVNRVFERLYKKPMVDLIGKKCYWEFERRNGACPHCPGAAALVSGEAHSADATGIGPDGCQYMVRLTSYPIAGPSGEPVGFVEVDEDVTEKRRSEKLVELLDGLGASLHTTDDNTTSLVRHALDSALSLEGVDFGCAYVRDQARGEYRAIAQRGVSRDLAEAIAQQTPEPISGAISPGSSSIPGAAGSMHPTAVALIPIMHDGVSVARLLVGSSTYAQFSSATLAALDALGKMAGGAIANLAAKQLQKEMRVYLRALLQFMPVPVWCVDNNLTVTMWNRSAERVFGWKEEEVLRAHTQLSSSDGDDPLESFLRAASAARDAGGHQFQCVNKRGETLQVIASAMPLPQVIQPRGAELGRVVVAEVSEAFVSSPSPLDAGDLEKTPVLFCEHPVPSEPTESVRSLSLRVLVVEHDDAQRRTLTEFVSGLGAQVVECAFTSTALALCAEGAASSHRFDVVIAELLPAGGCGGLDLAGSLWRIDPRVEVILSADSVVVGLESHGIAGALLRPFTREAVRKMIAQVLLGRRAV